MAQQSPKFCMMDEPTDLFQLRIIFFSIFRTSLGRQATDYLLLHLLYNQEASLNIFKEKTMEAATKIDLFGGALTAMVPKGFFSDISTVRQVPDNQEVFVSNAFPNVAVRIN